MALFPGRWTSFPQIGPLREQLKRIVQENLAKSPVAWAFKDPRTAQLLPLWHEIAKGLQSELRYVVVLRDPREVSESLRVRDAMNPVRGELLWTEHYLDALLYTTAASRAFIAYDAWFEDAQETAKKLAGKLGLSAPNDDRVRELVSSLVSTEWRHHRRNDDEPAYLPLTREFYRAMLAEDEGTLQTLIPLLHLRRAFSAKVVECAMEVNGTVTREQSERIARLEQELRTLRR